MVPGLTDFTYDHEDQEVFPFHYAKQYLTSTCLGFSRHVPHAVKIAGDISDDIQNVLMVDISIFHQQNHCVPQMLYASNSWIPTVFGA